MADFTATRTTHWTSFSNRIRWEVVEVHVLLFAIFFEGIDHLRIARRTQRTGGQNLRLATGEETRTVDAWEESHFTADITDVTCSTTIRTASFGQDEVTELFLDDLISTFLKVCNVVRICCRKGIDNLVDQESQTSFTACLIWILKTRAQGCTELLTDHLDDFIVDFMEFDGDLLLASLGTKLVECCTLRLDHIMCEVKSCQHLLFGDFACARFHHQDCLCRTCDHEVERGCGDLLLSWVGDEGAIFSDAYACRTDWASPWDVRDGEGCGCCQYGKNIRHVVEVDRQWHRDDLNIVSHSLIKQRAKRSVDQT